MNKNLKRIIAMVLAVGTVSAVSPATNLNLLTTKAYASDTNDESTLDSLELFDKDGHAIKFYEENDYKDRVEEDEVDEDTTYYAETSSNTVSIEVDGPSNKYVKIFNSTSDSAKGKEVNDDIYLDDDSVVTTLVIKVYEKDTEDDTVRNNDDDDDEYDLLNTYKIKVRYIPEDDTDSLDSTDETSAADYDNIYLERLSIQGKMIELSESETKYVYNVDSDVAEVTVRATPEDEGDDDVTIDGKDAEYDDKYKVTVDLEKGENLIKIEVEDDGKSRIYTLVINRGSVSTTGTSGTNTNTNTNTQTDGTEKTNKWVQVNGFWQYNDAQGKPVKNTWVGNYYLLDNGNMATGWVNYGGNWYYLGIDGAKKTGWQKVDGIWYHLDSQGKIQRGWFKDIDGKYYYLNNFGGMAYSTTIDGYRLGANGAWTGR